MSKAIWLNVAVCIVVLVTAEAGLCNDPARLAPRAFRVAVAQVKPSVVTIETYGTVSVAGGKRGTRFGAFSRPGEGPTTGLIVSANGHIVTSTFNFIRKPSVITVVLSDGSQHVAKRIGTDETRKICVLKIDPPTPLPVPVFVPADRVRVGQWAISMGVGYGGDQSAISAGIISAVNRVSGRAVQTDANISPANYGGPLLDINGRVIGVCVPLSPAGEQTIAGAEWYDSGIGFAVPLVDQHDILTRLKNGESIRAGKMGIVAAPLPMGQGVRLTQVAKNSPASRAGLQADDILIGIGKLRVIDMLSLRVAMGRYAAGDEVVVEFKRDGREMSVKITLEAGPFDYVHEATDAATAEPSSDDAKTPKPE